MEEEVEYILEEYPKGEQEEVKEEEQEEEQEKEH